MTLQEPAIDPQGDLREARTALLRLDPYVCFAGGWLRVSDVIRHVGWTAAVQRHPELARLLKII